ncbi:histamine H4 receptor isoform X2 [Lepus europaeus]|uniref:histamine H4 receptor isoform X2 n=1 Tax=Lepus europaeus TaxID=9983 RepID=UPI002B487BDC|nr:histamine H4 receptor isoform X2 [Lepus europaeus]
MSNTNSTTHLTPSDSIALAFLMSLLAFFIAVGNAVVILAFVVDKNLRHRSNYFFLNLAISDFFVVNTPLILISESWKNGSQGCEPGFFSTWYILVITALFEILVPVISVAYFNVYIYRRLRKRGNVTRDGGHPRLPAVPSSVCGYLLRCRLLSRTALPTSEEAERQGNKSSLLTSLQTQTKKNIIASKPGSLSHSDSLCLRQREHLKLFRASKLAKSLAILLGVFVVCWTPYSLYTIVRSTYPQAERPKSEWYEITFWLQWLNSFVNPFLYPLCHKRFRKAFLKIFCLKKQPSPSQTPSLSS